MVTRHAATQHAAVVDHSAEVDHSAAAGRSAEADRSAVVVLDAAADHFVALVGIRVVLNGAQSVARSVVLNGARSVALNAVRKFSWGDFRSVALAVAPVAVRLVAQVVAQFVAAEGRQYREFTNPTNPVRGEAVLGIAYVRIDDRATNNRTTQRADNVLDFRELRHSKSVISRLPKVKARVLVSVLN